MKIQLPMLAAMAALAFPSGALAQDAQDTSSARTDAEESADKKSTEAKAPNGIDSFGFGVGLALQLGASAVDEAAVEAGIVRVTREADAQAGLVLEGHYLFAFEDTEDTEIGLGPFVAVQAGSSDVIDSVGVGAMIGLRRTASSKRRGWGGGFNLGIGVMFDPNVQKLGDGLIRNEPLPPGETEVRYREEHAFRGVIMITYSP